MIWAQCWGIPLEVWDIENIRKIVATVEDLIEVDDNVDEQRRLDRARILIRTPRRPLVHHSVVVHIGGEVHKVYIVEEGCTDIGMRTSPGRSATDSSEEVESEDSDIRTMFEAPETTLDFQTGRASLGGKRNAVDDNRQTSPLLDGHRAMENPLDITPCAQTHLPSTDKRVRTNAEKGKQQNSKKRNTEPCIDEDGTCKATKKKDWGSKEKVLATEECIGYTRKEIAVLSKEGQRDFD